MIKDIKDIFYTKEVYNVYSACMFKPTFEKFEAMALSFKNDSTISIYGYFNENSIVGTIAVKEEQNTIEIIGISVANKERHSNIGTKLIDYIRENTIKQIIAETDSDAVGFYKKYGFDIKEYTVSIADETYIRYLCSLN